MGFELTEEQKAWKEKARKFAEEILAPIQKENRERGCYSREAIREMGTSGFFGTLIPPEYGGNDAGFLATVLIIEELAQVSSAYSLVPMSLTVGPGLVILRHGTREQKEKYLTGIVKGEIVISFGSTEPVCGSDVAAMLTTAVEKDDHFLLNGTKTWITCACVADVGLYTVYTDKEKKTGGMSTFIVEHKTPGVSTIEIDELGLTGMGTGEVAFQDVKVPKENLLGNRGDGYRDLMEMLGETRICAATRALGLIGACLKDCINFFKERKEAGQRVAGLQSIQARIAEMHANHEAAKLLIYQAAINKDKGIGTPMEVATAKYFACEAAAKVAEVAMELRAAYGFPISLRLERYMRDSRAFPITEGTSNILRIIISGGLLR